MSRGKTLKKPSREACQNLIDAIDAYIEKADTASLWERLRKAGYTQIKRTQEMVDAVEGRLAPLWIREGSRIIARIRRIQAAGGYDLYGMLNALLDTGAATQDDGLYFAEAVAQTMRSAFRNLMPDLIRSYHAQIDSKLVIGSMTQRTTAWIDSHSKQLGEWMRLSTTDGLTRILKQGLADGSSVDKVMRQIEEAGIRTPTWKARRVALTEMLRAHSYSQLEVYRTNPAVAGKRWMHTGAKFSDPRPNHVAMDGRASNADGTFTLVGADGNTYYPQCPRDTSLPPGESINCHCAMQPIVNTEIFGMSQKERQAMYDEAVALDNGAWRAQANNQARRAAEAYRGETRSGIVGVETESIGRLRAGSTQYYRALDHSETIQERIKKTNPHYSEGEEYQINCQRCVTAYEARARGLDVEALPARVYNDSTPYIYQDKLPYARDVGGWAHVYERGKLVPMSSNSANGVINKIDKQMGKWGDGSRAIVRVSWSRGDSGHVFIAHKENGTTRFIDPQTGESDVSWYFSRIKLRGDRQPQLMRIDDLPFTELLSECIKDTAK